MTQAYETLHHACAAHGTRLFTVSILKQDPEVAYRAYTSHPVEYPVSGLKPVEHDGWYDLVITRRQTFVANTAPEFARYFFDHALITSMGLGSCINVPVADAGGRVWGTVNLLAEAGHFTDDRLTAYHALIARHHAALLTAMQAG